MSSKVLISFHVSEEFKIALDRLASSCGLQVADTIRQAIAEGAPLLQKKRKAVMAEEADKLEKEPLPPA